MNISLHLLYSYCTVLRPVSTQFTVILTKKGQEQPQSPGSEHRRPSSESLRSTFCFDQLHPRSCVRHQISTYMLSGPVIDSIRRSQQVKKHIYINSPGCLRREVTDEQGLNNGCLFLLPDRQQANNTDDSNTV